MNGLVTTVMPRVPLIVQIVRHKRARCLSCGQRRVLYTIGASAEESLLLAETAPFCAPCWGIR